jgi:glucokinase
MKIAGIDIGGTEVKLGLFDPDKGLLKSWRLATVLADPHQLADQLAENIAALEVDLVGIGTAGAVNTSTGLVSAGNLGWYDVPLRQIMQQRLERPVWVDNDAKVALMAESYDGACAGLDNVVFLTLGTGIGGALLINGKPWRGHNNTAAELGHIVTHADGLVCACTKRGCLEMYASAKALARLVPGLTAREIVDRARAGKSPCQEAFASYIHELATGLVTLIMVFNPQMIVLGGGISQSGAILLDGVREEIARLFAGRPAYFAGTIELAHHRNDAGMIGAAVLARDQLMQK